MRIKRKHSSTYYIIKYPRPHEVGHPCHLVDIY